MTYTTLQKQRSNTLSLTLKSILLLVSFLASYQGHAKPKKNLSIGLLQIVAHQALDQTRNGIIEGLKRIDPSLQITVKIAHGNIINATMIAQKFISEEVDVLVVLGTAAAQVAVKAASLSKTPVVFASITDPLGAKLVKNLDQPGTFVTGVSNDTPQAPQLSYFKELVPTLKTLGLIYNPGESNSVMLLQRTLQAAQELGIQILPAAVSKTTEVSLATQKLIAKGVDGIFINNDNTALSAFDVIARLCYKEKKPLFVSDTDMVKQGALAAMGPNQYTLGLQGARIISRILKGESPQNIPVSFPEKQERRLNLKIAHYLGIEIPQDSKVENPIGPTSQPLNPQKMHQSK